MNIGLLNNLLNENSVQNDKKLTNSLQKVSSGLKINKASDNASGLAISDKLRTQASGIKQGIDNTNSAIAMMNIADKSMSELSNILDIIKSKAIQMNTDTTSKEGRKIIKTEILKLIDSYDSIVEKTNYNETPLLNGSSSPFNFQVGDNSSDSISVNVDSIESKKMGQEDPYKLKNFITGFTEISSTSNVNESLLAGQTGIVRINFSWNEDVALEPVLVDPNGDVMGNAGSFYVSLGDINNNPYSTDTGGFNDVSYIDNNTPNQYNYYYDPSAPTGDYEFYIRNFGNFYDGNPPIDVSVTIKTGDNIEVRHISVSSTDWTIVGPFTFNYGEENSNGDTIFSTVRNDDNPDLKNQAQNLMNVIDESLSQLNIQRSNVGAGINALETSSRFHLSSYVNLKNAESIIRDTDYEEESANFNKFTIISQAGSYVQSQANKIDQSIVTNLLK